MVRAWIIFFCLTISVVFRVFSEETKEYFQFFNGKPFLFSDRLLDKHSYTYFFMELMIAIGYASCMLIQDQTPKFFLWLFLGIMIFDLLHFILWMRDPGPGWNIIKCAMFGVPLLAYEIKTRWTRFNQ